MENFTMYNPTNLRFGRGVINGLSDCIAEFGKKVLLVYGMGSVKRNGVYQQVVAQLKKAGCEILEYAGIKPNPVVDDVDKAAALGRKYNVDVIVAVGGGSVIDSAKFISVTIPVKHTAWDFIENKAKPMHAVPLIAVLTLAATGSEMNGFAVIQNDKTKQKPGFYCPLFFPKYSFLDPEYTCSVPRNYTAYGLMDIIAHCLEGYFGKGESPLTDKFALDIIREVMEIGPKLLNRLNDYELRARIMFASTMALNGLVLTGKTAGDWGVHSIGHTLSVLYDIPHGATLSIAYPAWFKHMIDKIYRKMLVLGQSLFNTTNTAETIFEFESLFRKIECPVRLSDIKIGKNQKDEILSNLLVNKADGYNYKLNEASLSAIVDLMM